MSQHEGIDVHRAMLVGLVAWVPMMPVPETVVTGDAVVLDVQVAQLPVRAVGALIDIGIVVVGYLVGVMLWAATVPVRRGAQRGNPGIFTVLAIVGYPVILETATRGRSVGKIVMGLRVVSDDGGPERFRQALFRSLAGFVEIWTFLGGPAVICSLASAKGKRIGDLFAGTVVISERGPKLAPPPVMPPTLAWWASSLELSGLGPEQAEMARQFLGRATQLDPAVRDEMAYRIAADVAARIRRRHRRGCPRSMSWPRCSPSGTAANWPGCARPCRRRAIRRTRPRQPTPPLSRRPSHRDGFIPPA